MAIESSSRYIDVGTYTSEDVTGRKQDGFELRSRPKASGFFYYRPSEVERLDHIANTFYHDPKKFWKLCDASDELDPGDVLSPGVPILIPEDK